MPGYCKALPPELRAEIIKLARAGSTPLEIHRLTKAGRSTIYRLLNEEGIDWAATQAARPIGRPPRPMTEEHQVIAEAMYNDGRSLNQIADQIQIPPGRISAWLRAKGYDPKMRRRDAIRIDRAVQAYKAGRTVRWIEDNIGVPSPTLYANLARLGIPLRRSEGTAEETVTEPA